MILLANSRITKTEVVAQPNQSNSAGPIVRIGLETKGDKANITTTSEFHLDDPESNADLRNQLGNIGVDETMSDSQLLNQLKGIRGKSVVARYYSREEGGYRAYITDWTPDDFDGLESKLRPCDGDRQLAEIVMADDSDSVWLVLFIPLDIGDAFTGTYLVEAVTEEELVFKEGDAVDVWWANGGPETYHVVEFDDGTRIHFHPDEETCGVGRYQVEYDDGNGPGLED